MIFGSDDEDGGPSLILNGVRIPFQMEAQVSHGPPPGDPDDDWDETAPGMIRLPVEIEVMLPHDVLHRPAPPPTPPGRADPAPHVRPAASDPGAFSLPPGVPGRRRRRPVTLRALQSLGLDQTLRHMADGPPAPPGLPGRVPAPNASNGAGDANDDPDERAIPARLPNGGADGGTTGHRALDAAFAAGPIPGLDRMLRPATSTGPDAGTGSVGTAIR